MDDYRLSGYLFRASLARFEFDRPPRLYCEPRFGPIERLLLEVHEHNHWALAHASLFGIGQLSLAYAQLLAQSEEQKARYRDCLQITTDLSRAVYEGCAVYHEKAFVRRHGVLVNDEWFAPLEGSVYGSSFELFDSFLSSLPFGDSLKASIATNVAELVLNSTPRFLSVPARLEPKEMERRISERSPNALLNALSAYLSDNSHYFAEAIRQQVIRPTADSLGRAPDNLLFEEIVQTVDRRVTGEASYRTFVAVRDFALRAGLAMFEGSPEAVDLMRYDIWLTWVRGLPGHERFYPNLVRDVAPMALRAEPVTSGERNDFETFRTSFIPPEGLDRDDIVLADWRPLKNAVAASQPFKETPDHSRVPFSPSRGQTSSGRTGGALNHRLYISLSDGLQETPIPEVINASPLTAFVGGAVSQSFGSSLTVSMSVEDGKRRFDEVTAPLPIDSIVVRAGRALLHPKNYFGWKQLGARYQLSVPAKDKQTIAAELVELSKAVAVRRRNFDMSTFSAFGVPCAAFDSTVGVLIEESSAFGWERELDEVMQAGLGAGLLSIRIGGASGYLLMLALLTRSGSNTRAFLYSPASAHVVLRVHSVIKENSTSGGSVCWVESLADADVSATHRESILLICEHLMLRGF